MSKTTDYTKLAASLDYAAIEKKLTQLAERQPPKKRKNAADALEPLRERLLELHRKGWSSGQLAEELKIAGVPVSPARLRDCLNRWAHGGSRLPRRVARRPATGDTSAAASAASTTPSTSPKMPTPAPPQSSFTLR